MGGEQQYAEKVVGDARLISSGFPGFRLTGTEAQQQVVCTVCCMYSDERVICECSVLVFGFFFFFISLFYVQTWGVFGSFVHAVAACGASENWTPGSLTSATTGQQANECSKQKTREEGRRAGQERGKSVSITVGDGCPCSPPLGLCKCIISKFCYMFDSLTSGHLQ